MILQSLHVVWVICKQPCFLQQSLPVLAAWRTSTRSAEAHNSVSMDTHAVDAVGCCRLHWSWYILHPLALSSHITHTDGPHHQHTTFIQVHWTTHVCEDTLEDQHTNKCKNTCVWPKGSQACHCDSLMGPLMLVARHTCYKQVICQVCKLQTAYCLLVHNQAIVSKLQMGCTHFLELSPGDRAPSGELGGKSEPEPD